MPKVRARPQQLGGHERAAVVQIDGLGQASRGQPGSQGGLGAHGVLGGHPPIAGEKPGVIVQEREQHGLVPADDRAVQGVADPQLVRPGRLEAAEDRPVRLQGPAGETDPTEVALDGPLIGCPADD